MRPEAKLLEFAELLFFAYRDFTRDPDAILKDFSFGRAHHRVLHFVNRHSGLRVADLLVILTITKQSLSRVLKQLIDKGYIVQQAGASDRRERLLFPTDKGRALAERLAAPQSVRLAEALEGGGTGSRGGFAPFSRIHGQCRRTAQSLLDHGRIPGPAQNGRQGGRLMTMPTPIKVHRGSPDDNAPHILVVDDDSRIRDLLARYLQDNGFRVTTAIDAASARATMRSLSFDLLILDVMMPQESGLDFARSLRNESHVPILMLTARAEPEHRIEGLETGVDDYLAKPFEPRELLLRVSNVLRRGGASPLDRRGAHGRVRVPRLARRAQA